VVEAPWDAKRLARLLFFSNGVSRTSRAAFGETTYFRTAMSAGNLHPVEIYVVCGDLGGVSAVCIISRRSSSGSPCFRRGDYRGALAAAASDPRVLCSAGHPRGQRDPWRTGWKYSERGFRHLYWDAGRCSQNLLVVEPSASVAVGFVDDQVARLVGVDGVSEFRSRFVVLCESETARTNGATPDTGTVGPLERAVEAISRAPIEFRSSPGAADGPSLTGRPRAVVHRASSLDTPTGRGGPAGERVC